jgi:hypothetical protein
MTLNKLASMLALKEGKKSQARVGDIRELLSLMVQMELETSTSADGHYALGDIVGFFVDSVMKKRAKKAKKKAKKK